MFRKLFVPVLLLVILSACGLSNTMYNARNYFKSAQARPLNSNGRPNSQAIEEYTKTIQKCGIIISEKKSDKQVEEALYLMARALYYKGNSAFQAKDQFENLINLFPESRHVPDANIYLARIYREINQPQVAESRLESFIRNPLFTKSHPKALLVLADFEIRDEDYLRAEYWLQKVVNEYGDTKEAKEAQFLIGKNFYQQKLYQQSVESFEDLTDTFRLDRQLKLEAQYYLALNRYYLGQYDRALDLINNVLKNEARLDKLGAAKVIKGRIMADSGKLEEGMEELEAVLTTYPRTLASSEAAFYLGEYSFYNQQDLAVATTYYNRVRTESPTGEFVEEAQAKVSALQQLSQGANLNSETNLQQFLDYHYLAADNYDKRFNLPDSSLMIYDRLISERDNLQSIVDSLLIEKIVIETRIDSLRMVRANPPDSVATLAHPDSIQIDSRIASLESEMTTKQNKVSRIQESIGRFDEEVVPFVWFVKANLRMKMGQKDPEVAQILELMREQYPGNKYTNAIRSLYNGQRVRVIDPAVEEAEERLDYALGLYPAEPDSMVSSLVTLLDAPSDEIRLKANFRLGWFYSVESPDTTAAKAYLDAVLEAPENGAYGDWVRKIYDGSEFLIYDNEATKDSLDQESPDLPIISEPDSLVSIDSLAVSSDSLQSVDTTQADTSSEPEMPVELDESTAVVDSLDSRPIEDAPEQGTPDAIPEELSAPETYPEVPTNPVPELPQPSEDPPQESLNNDNSETTNVDSPSDAEDKEIPQDETSPPAVPDEPQDTDAGTTGSG